MTPTHRSHRIAAFALMIVSGCVGNSILPPRQEIVVDVEGDVDSFNPLFAEEETSGEINDLLYPSLVASEFDIRSGTLTYLPSFARSWEYSNQGKDITFHLKSNATWADGAALTAGDVKRSFMLYGSDQVGSVRQSSVSGLRKEGADLSGSIDTPDDTTIVFHFERAYSGQLFDVGLPIIPEHVYGSIAPGDLRTAQANQHPVSAGPFVLAQRTPLQEILLVPNALSHLPYPAKSSLVFRVVPDYHTRIRQLTAGEVDIVSGIRPEDAETIERANPSVRLVSTVGRDYDFLGWSNIDQRKYRESKGTVVVPHPLFGPARVRTALTMAINRSEIVKAYLDTHGEVAFGGVSPLFRWAFNDTLAPLPFDPGTASRLLSDAGWKHTGGDGILRQGDQRFSFTMIIPTGNQLRMVIASVIQQQLRAVGVEMAIRQVERGTFWEEVTHHAYDAFFAGFSVPLQMQLDDLWGSDLAKHPFNLTGYRNSRVDAILAEARSLPHETDGEALWKEFQTIIQKDQPCTFLFWQHTITGVNRRVTGMHSSVLGLTHDAWDWHVSRNDTVAAPP
jgi:peptide/nickel transport system substrate-binding protein